MTKDGAIFAKGKVKGEINYPPFEDLDQEAMREVQKFHVYPLGKISEYCRHIPYNSEKKSFMEKTGRESFEGMSIRWSLSVSDFPQCFNIPTRCLVMRRSTMYCGIITLDL